MSAPPPLRVAQWGTGLVGASCIRAIAAHPALQLVAGLVYNLDKVGRDLGALAGIEDLGVLATDSSDVILAADPDCVVHTPKAEKLRSSAIDDICALLAAGVNVASTCLQDIMHPAAILEPEYLARIEAACQVGQTTFHGAATSPGFATEYLPLFLSGLSSQIEEIRVTELWHYEFNPSKSTVMDLVKFGRPLSEKKLQPALASGPARAPLYAFADAFGMSIDDVEFSYELCAAEEDLHVAAGTIPAGSFAGFRRTYSGVFAGRRRVTLEYVHRASRQVAPHWPGPSGPAWTIEITGRPTIRSTVELELDESAASPGSLAAAARVVELRALRLPERARLGVRAATADHHRSSEVAQLGPFAARPRTTSAACLAVRATRPETWLRSSGVSAGCPATRHPHRHPRL